MKPTATTGAIALSMENPVLQTQHFQFEQVVEEYRARVLRFVFASIRDIDAAETLTQDCFWNAYRNWNSFRGECSVHTWLIKIAVNLVRDHARNRRLQFWKRAERVPSEAIQDWPDGGISPEERAALNEQVQSIWNATTTLSERQRTVFLLRFVEDLDISEIAHSTGLTESTVQVHLARAVRRIRKRLGHET